ncbi:hypothetical protein D3C84_867670 [compost metagenome]
MRTVDAFERKRTYKILLAKGNEGLYIVHASISTLLVKPVLDNVAAASKRIKSRDAQVSKVLFVKETLAT